MSIHIINDLSGLEVINTTLESKKNELSEIKFEKIIENLGLLLKDLEYHLKKIKCTPVTETLIPSITSVLNALDLTLGSYKVSTDDKVAVIRKKLSTIVSSVSIAHLNKNNAVKPMKVPYLAMFFDLSCTDHNGGITSTLKLAFQQGVPFITSRSMLLGTGIWNKDRKKLLDNFIDLQKNIVEFAFMWNVFQKGEVFVFIPESHFSEKTEQEVLATFDLCSDGSLKRSSVETIYAEMPKKIEIENFLELFSKKTVGKLFFIAGHGGSSTIAGLNFKEYMKLRKFFYKHCVGLGIFSCESGGKNSLLHIPDHVHSSTSFLEQEKDNPYPVLLRSLGDVSAYNNQPAEADLKVFLDEFASFIDGSQTIKELRKRIIKVENGRSKAPQNWIKFYPACSAGIPGGFRPILETKNAFAITYGSLKQSEILPVISSKIKKGKPETSEITITDADVLEIHPLVVPNLIRIFGFTPVLVSMTPGDGHHFIKRFDLYCSFSLLTFLHRTLVENKKCSAFKGIFIEAISTLEKSYFGVALGLFSENSICVWREECGGCYLSLDGLTGKQITYLQYGIICREIINKTVSDVKATISMAAGQEDEGMFQEAVNGSLFSTGFENLFKLDDRKFFYVFKKRMKGLKKSDAEAAVFYLLENGNPERALELFKREKLSPNILKFDGTPLIFTAVKTNALGMVDYLLKKEANVNVTSPNGTPVLYMAAMQVRNLYQKKDTELDFDSKMEIRVKILDMILGHPLIDLEATHKFGWTAISVVLKLPEILEKFFIKGAKINYCNEKKSFYSQTTLLSAFIITQQAEEIEALIKNFADPNLGTPSALNYAVQLNDIDLVKKLLKSGGKPFKADSGGIIPIVEACFYASPEILELFLERDDCNLQVISDKGMFPLLAALIAGNKTKLNMLLEKGAIFPKNWVGDWSILYFVLDKYLLFNDEESILNLLKIEGVPKRAVGYHLLERRHPVLETCIKQTLLSKDDVLTILRYGKKPFQPELEAFAPNKNDCMLLKSG